MKSIILLLAATLFACAAIGQAKDTIIVYRVTSWMDMQTMKEGVNYVVDTPSVYSVEMLPGYKYTLKKELADITIPANSFNDQQGVEVSGQVVGSIDRSDWIKWRINSPRIATELVYRYAMADNVFGGVEIRIGSTSGPLAGSAVLKPTGGWGNFFDVTIPVSIAPGPVDLFFTFRNSVRDAGAGGNLLQFTIK